MVRVQGVEVSFHAADADKILDDYLAKNPEAKLEWEETQQVEENPRHGRWKAVASYQFGRVAAVMERAQG